VNVTMIEWVTATADPVARKGEPAISDSVAAEIPDSLDVDDPCVGVDQAADAEAAPTTEPGTDPDLWLYRDRTIALLRRYMRLALEVGRLPSILGREFFRTRVTSYHTQTFEDSVIFVQDIERSLDVLDATDKLLIALIVLEDHTYEGAARLLHCTERTIRRQYPETLDRISEIFLKREILSRLPPREPTRPQACQEGENVEFPASDSVQGKNKV
jgi:DNA-directed RNA polymerase specialized sigma24 family protein